jgi:nucleoside-diphosphate-sugar epimerase
MKALVTGGGGFIGKAIVKALLARGDEVRSFSRGDYPELRELGAETFRGDIGDAEAVTEAVQGCDVVFHVAARFDLWGRREDFVRTNLTGTENVIEACRKSGCAKLVYTSTPSVVHGGGSVDGADESLPYPEHFEALYPETKAAAEREVLAANDANLSTAAIRPHLVWGVGDSNGLPRLLERARAGRLRLIGRDKKIDTTYIDNAVAAHLAAADRLEPTAACAGKAYFVTQDDPTTAEAFINDMLRAAGEPAITRRVSPGVARFAAGLIEAIWKTLGIEREPPVTKFMVSQLATAHWYDISAARSDLGYVPKVSYDEGMKRLAGWLEEHPL